MANVGVTRFGATATAAILDDLAHRQVIARPTKTLPGKDFRRDCRPDNRVSFASGAA